MSVVSYTPGGWQDAWRRGAIDGTRAYHVELPEGPTLLLDAPYHESALDGNYLVGTDLWNQQHRVLLEDIRMITVAPELSAERKGQVITYEVDGFGSISNVYQLHKLTLDILSAADRGGDHFPRFTLLRKVDTRITSLFIKTRITIVGIEGDNFRITKDEITIPGLSVRMTNDGGRESLSVNWNNQSPYYVVHLSSVHSPLAEIAGKIRSFFPYVFKST